MSRRLFLIHITIKDTTSLSNTIRKITAYLGGYADAAKVLYRFKITGEPRVIAVFEVLNVVGMERNLNGLSTLGISDISCTPLVAFEEFAQTIGVTDPSLTAPSSYNIQEKELHWLEISIDHNGMSQTDLLKIWCKEAITLLTTRVHEHAAIELFKVCSERKVHLFVCAKSTDLDNMVLNLPMCQENGANVKVTCKAIHQLDDYNIRINTEQI